jgi:hypothetical protein
MFEAVFSLTVLVHLMHMLSEPMMAVASGFGVVDGGTVAHQATMLFTGASGVTDAIDDLIAFVKPIGWGLASLGIILFAVAKMASPLFPEMMGRFQGTISNVAIGAFFLGLAPTVVGILKDAFDSGTT